MAIFTTSAIGILIKEGDYEKYSKIFSVEDNEKEIFEKIYETIEKLELKEDIEVENIEGGILIFFKEYYSTVECFPGSIDAISFPLNEKLMKKVKTFKSKIYGSPLSLEEISFHTFTTVG